MFKRQVWTKSIGEMFVGNLLALLLPVVVLLFCSAAEADGDGYGGHEFPFDEAEIYFELNNTDGDLGIHALIDGEPWKRLTIEDPRERELLNIFVQTRLRRQGLTEIFFESAEPTFDELLPAKFFRRFPAGEYEIEGTTLDNKEMESVAELTHLLPAQPENIRVNGSLLSPGCDEDDPKMVTDTGEGLVISWAPVTLSHPELGETNQPIFVEQYEVVLEEEELGLVFSVELPPDENQVQVPQAFLELGEEFKLEILVREESHNQTAVETCFVIDLAD